jgi:large subunit ribosomal protein L25
MDQVTIDAQPRTALRKKTGALRRSGITPIHVYGRGTDSLTLQAPTQELIHTLSAVGFTTPLTVKVGGDEHFVIVQQIQRHPVTEALLHVDLIAVSRTERRQAAVPVQFEGDAPAAREEGAQLFEDLHELEVEALPTDIPSVLIVDLSTLVAVDTAIHAGDIELPSGVTLVTDPTSFVARIVRRRGATDDGEPTEGGAEAPVAQAAPAPEAAAGDAEAPAET